MGEKIRDVILALIGVIVFPVVLFIELVRWLFESKSK